jgi:hypothetical protein
VVSSLTPVTNSPTYFTPCRWDHDP